MQRLAHAGLLLGQIFFFVVVWLASDALARYAGWPIPGSVIGLALVAALLFSRLLPSRYVQRGADWLLAEMLLFFIPPVVAVVNFGPLIASQGWRLLAVLLLGMLVVMIGTGLVVDWVFHYERRRHAQAAGRGDGS
ncbi:CidA/LrgA family protein [Chitinimonas naiadis]